MVAVKEQDAFDRFWQTHGIVNAIRLISYARMAEARGEEWLAENVSRQQLAKIRASYEAAGVPWGEGKIQFGAITAKAQRAARAAETRKRELRERRSRRGLRSASV